MLRQELLPDERKHVEQAKKFNNIIVTAATSEYFQSFLQLLYSYRQKEIVQSRLVFYDLGLTEDQVTYFLHHLLARNSDLSYRKFDFEKHPSFVSPQFKTYAWKPLIIQEVLEGEKANVLWLDSANLILKPLKQIWETIQHTGSYLPISGSGSLERWTHPDVLQFLDVSTEDRAKRNRCGGLCGFSYHASSARELVHDWAHHALIKKHIKPEGSSRLNHRDDQSLLTILAYNYERTNQLMLSSDEVNISSSHPIDTISVRNILPKNFPRSLFFCSIVYFKLKRKIDILINRISK